MKTKFSLIHRNGIYYWQDRKRAEQIIEKSILIYPAEDLGVPEGFVDTVASTTLKEKRV